MIIDPRTKEPYYVGATVDPHKRKNDHRNGMNVSKVMRGRQSELSKSHKRPMFEIIEEVNAAQRQEKEAYWHDCLVLMGFHLLNKRRFTHSVG